MPWCLHVLDQNRTRQVLKYAYLVIVFFIFGIPPSTQSNHLIRNPLTKVFGHGSLEFNCRSQARYIIWLSISLLVETLQSEYLQVYPLPGSSLSVSIVWMLLGECCGVSYCQTSLLVGSTRSIRVAAITSLEWRYHSLCISRRSATHHSYMAYYYYRCKILIRSTMASYLLT